MARAEGYIRPPIVALEPANQRAARIRLIAILVVVAIALAVGVWIAARAVINHGEGGLGNEGAIHQIVAAALAPGLI